VPDQPWTALAPMQDVTDLPFMQVIGHYGPPDYFFTEYFRVHETSRLERHILDSITEQTTGRPVFAQLIGHDLVHLRRTIEELLKYPVAGIDLNMGCPAPKVYKKNVGGGLLRNPDDIERVFDTMREACPGLFTVKTRIGFDDTSHFDRVLELVNQYHVDLLSLHGRTVKELYRSEVHYDWIRKAREGVNCPMFANGNISSAAHCAEIITYTRCEGAMIGRGAIRNPWIFRQIREHYAGQPVFAPTLADVRDYVDRLWVATTPVRPGVPDNKRLNKMKKLLNFVGQGVDPEGAFLKEMRRAREVEPFFAICDRHLGGERASEPFSCEPYEGVVARPNCEVPINTADGCRL